MSDNNSSKHNTDEMNVYIYICREARREREGAGVIKTNIYIFRSFTNTL